jgi:hypothetical protein
MIRNLVARFTLTTLAAIACSPSSQPAESRQAETARTLEEAKARAQDLANSTQNYQPVRFVSAIEQVRAPRPVRDPKPADVVKKGTDSITVDPIPMPAPVQDETVPAVQSDATADTPIAPRVPSIIPREAPVPAAVGGGTGDWRGNDPGPDMGTTIGVVLRGGRVDPGHCPRHPRPPSQIPHRIPRR